MVELQIGSGDWISLSEAARICTKKFSKSDSEKTEEDVLKLGFLTYENIPRHLKIYSFVRGPVKISPFEFSTELKQLLPSIPFFGAGLSDAAKTAATRMLLAGDVFELPATILEKLALLHQWWTGAAAAVVIRAFSFTEIAGWEHQKPKDGSAIPMWTATFDGAMDPDIEIRWEDLRVDREELLELLEIVESSDGGHHPHRKNVDAELTDRERRSLLTIIAALAKKAKLDLDHPTTAGDAIAAQVDQIGLNLSSRAIQNYIRGIADRLNIPGK